ncbi:MAG TPA: methyltransferase domain-containing protein [Polyangiaceae bacterium]|jgi:SAM-dependent methyltransferase|nr:methyltransferase domain-containing protein [Polyangiaceae bacterium]
MHNRWSSVANKEPASNSESPISEARLKPRQADPFRLVRRTSRAAELSLEDFTRYFPYSPTALAIKECARLSVVRRYQCPGPVLDVGCGDGLFARMAFEGAEVWGIDIDAKEGRWASASQAYTQVILGDVTRASLPEAFFATCVANCSLEHVPRIDLALKNILSALRPGGFAYLFVPSAEWASHLTSSRVLAGLGAPSLALHIQRSIDQLFRHHHLYDAQGWARVVKESGLELVALEPVLSTGTTVAFEAFLLPSLAGLLNKHLTTRWTNFPRIRQAFARPVYQMVKAIMDHSDAAPTAEFFIAARRPEV